jgi:NUMOD4 motif
MSKIKSYVDEEWKEFFPQHKLKKRYAISNYGRLAWFTEKIEDGTLLKGSSVQGYRTFSYKKQHKTVIRNYALMLHKLVAENFCKRSSENQTYVIHLNFTKDSNYFKNLKWATYEEMLAHNKKSPLVIEAQRKFHELKKTKKGHKLTDATVALIKKKINNPNRKTRMKMIAKQFNISEMQLYRIKSGENWSRIKV